MADPLFDMPATETALRRVYDAAGPYLASLTDRPVHDPACDPLLDRLRGALPDKGEGAAEVAHRLIEIGTGAGTHSAGPRFYHFVTGGVTPAALAADWLVSLIDQNAFSRTSSQFATDVESVAIDWLRDLVGLPTGWGGALVQSATYANFTALGVATHWWAERRGVDVYHRRPRRAAPDAGVLRRLRARERPQGAADARPRQRRGRRCAPATRSAGWTCPRWTAHCPPWTVRRSSSPTRVR